MSQPVSNCPQCGAPIQHRFSSSVQTVCEYCNSIVVRTDVDLEKVGVVADLPATGSPIQLMTEGVYGNKAFVVAGRIVYEYEQGTWNEWHLIFHDGTTGWLSDAQLEYAVTFQAQQPLPAEENAQVGSQFLFNNAQYTVTSITSAHYRGVQGELPFQYWDKEDVTFVDLRTADGKFGTIDYSEEPPLLFLGEPVDFDALKLKNLVEFEGWTVNG